MTSLAVAVLAATSSSLLAAASSWYGPSKARPMPGHGRLVIPPGPRGARGTRACDGTPPSTLATTVQPRHRSSSWEG